MKILSRTNFKLLGIIFLLAGIITVIYTIFYIQNSTFTIQTWEEDQPITLSGETPFQKYLIGFLGLMMILIGYRSFRYIPPDERERETVSEQDLFTEDD